MSSSGSLRGQKDGLWTRCYVLFDEKGNIEQRRYRKVLVCQAWYAINCDYNQLQLSDSNHDCEWKMELN